MQHMSLIFAILSAWHLIFWSTWFGYHLHRRTVIRWSLVFTSRYSHCEMFNKHLFFPVSILLTKFTYKSSCNVNLRVLHSQTWFGWTPVLVLYEGLLIYLINSSSILIIPLELINIKPCWSISTCKVLLLPFIGIFTYKWFLSVYLLLFLIIPSVLLECKRV